MLTPGEPYVKEYEVAADPFGSESDLFTVTVIRRTEDLWSVTRFGHNYWWNGTSWDGPPKYRDDEITIEEWWATHRWPLEEAFEHAKTAVKGLTINGMTYDDWLDWVHHRDNGMDVEAWRKQRYAKGKSR